MDKSTIAPPVSADDLVQTPAIALYGPDGQAVEVPEEGSLGLLALGYVGLMLWRQKRRTAQAPESVRQGGIF